MVLKEKNNDVFLPNIIHLDGDPPNNSFIIKIDDDNDVIISSFHVMDRWGNKMASINNYMPRNNDILWDGKFNGNNVNPGVYIYQMILNVNGQEIIKQGDLTVLK